MSLDSPPKNNPQSVSSCFRVFGVFRGPTFPASVSHTRSLQIPGVQPGPKSMTLIFRTLPVWSAI
jgi:hypothetical protein